jgi:hypothetical protein
LSELTAIDKPQRKDIALFGSNTLTHFFNMSNGSALLLDHILGGIRELKHFWESSSLDEF